MTDAASRPDAPPATFASELVKLLLQVAWADHDVAPQEAEALMAFARREGLEAEELEQLSAMLSGKSALSPPNLGLLRQRRTDTLRAVKELLLLSNRAVVSEEEELLAQISSLLR